MRRAVIFVLAGILSVQFGAAIAKDLFGRIDPTAMVWLRLLTSALVLTLVATWPRRHSRGLEGSLMRGRGGDDWLVVVGFGVSLGLMNWAIYQSFARIPLGLAVTIEFVGPLAIAVLTSRRGRDLAWVALAGIGVVLLGFEPEGVTVAGVLFALLAGAAWAAYILLSAATGRRWSGLDGLAVASVIATLPLTPYAVAEGGGTLLEPEILVLGAAVGLLSSVIPYSFEMSALRTLPAGVFGILMSLEPAAAALAALLLLGEVLEPLQWLALACVIAASIGATRGGVLREPVPD